MHITRLREAGTPETGRARLLREVNRVARDVDRLRALVEQLPERPGREPARCGWCGVPAADGVCPAHADLHSDLSAIVEKAPLR